MQIRGLLPHASYCGCRDLLGCAIGNLLCYWGIPLEEREVTARRTRVALHFGAKSRGRLT
jgi:hypothetical protein